MSHKVRERKSKGGDAEKSVCGENEEQNGVEVKVSLAPLDSCDQELIRKWRNDYRIWKWCRQNDLISDSEQYDWFQKQSDDPSIRMYKIVIENGEEITPVGVCGLTSIDHINRRAEFSLYIAPKFQGNNLGKVSLSVLLTHGFKNLGLHLIWGEVFDGNPALEVFESLGFKREGIRRDFYFRDGKFIDAHLISIKEDEWKS